MKKFVDYLPFIGTLAFLIGYMYHMEALNIVMGLSYVLGGILKRRETKKVAFTLSALLGMAIIFVELVVMAGWR